MAFKNYKLQFTTIRRLLLQKMLSSMAMVHVLLGSAFLASSCQADQGMATQLCPFIGCEIREHDLTVLRNMVLICKVQVPQGTNTEM